MLLFILIPVFTIILSYSVLKIFKTINYWQNKDVPHIKPWPILGNMAGVALRQNSLAQLVEDYYNAFPNERYFGFFQFTKPTLMLRDPELIKDVCIKDFDTFTDRYEFLPESSDPFWNKNLFSMKGKEWHDMRCVLNPIFTGSKMRSMFIFMVECAQKYINHLKALSPNGDDIIDVEMKHTFLRFTNDIIATTAFGVELNSIEDKENEFYRLGKRAFEFEGIKGLKFFGSSISPRLMKLIGAEFFDDAFKTFFRELVNKTIAYRDRTGYVRRDMIHFLREAQKGREEVDNDTNVPDAGFAVDAKTNLVVQSNNKPVITNEDIAAQAAIFFFGGFDTVGIALTHTAYELAINPDVQKRLIEEVDQTLQKCDGEITYEILLGMKYLDMVVSEALRKWSPGLMLFRKCSKPYTIQPKNPNEKPLVLEKDSVITIPVRGIHHDPKYYPNPAKFDPERFSAENRHNIRFGTYIPFGLGPRNCIASRFGIVECKVMIFFLLGTFEIVPIEKTHVPFVLSKKSILITSDHGYWLGLKRRIQN